MTVRTVGELIAQLQVFDSDTPLRVSGTDSGGYDSVWKNKAKVIEAEGHVLVEGVGDDCYDNWLLVEEVSE